MEATMNKPVFQASKYQQAIFEAVERYDRDIVVSAVAGSGKSTTLKQLLDYIPERMSVLYLAFNSDAAKSLGDKLTSYAQEKQEQGENVCNYTSSTIHSLGNSTLRAAGIANKPKNNKYSQLCKAYLMDHMADFQYSLIAQFSKLVDMVRLTLSQTDEDSLKALMQRFEIDIQTHELDYNDNLVETEAWSTVKRGVSSVLKEGIRLARSAKEYDFTDMIWLPSSQAMNLQPKQYDWVLVDEAQDLSPAQRELVLKAKKSNGHFIAVGDRKQAIYGFAGASLRSIDEIIEATGAVEMPLSICYRCPQSVIDLANTIWPGTEARPDAPEGTLETIANDKVESLVKPGDLILCRLTAPLVEQCLSLLRKGIRANVRGKDLGAQFTSLLENIKKSAKVPEQRLFLDLVNLASAYERHQVAILSRNLDENEMKIDSLQDKMSTLLALYEAYLDQTGEESGSLQGFQDYIKAFFQDDPDAQIILSTGHRAKGLEYKRVFILQSDRLPHPKAKTVEAIIQEHNLMYVMYTRAMEALYLVREFIPVVLVKPAPEIIKATIEEIAPSEPQQESIKTVKTPAFSLPTVTNKGGKDKDGEYKTSDWVKVAYKFSPEIVAKLDALKKANPDLNKSAFIDGILAAWFEEHGL